MRAERKILKTAVRLPALLLLFFFSQMIVGPRVHAKTDRVFESPFVQGRGGAAIAGAEDEDAIFYNPAGIARGEGIFKKIVLLAPHIDFSMTAREVYQKIVNQEKDQTQVLRGLVGEPLHANFGLVSALVFRRAALAAFANNSFDAMVTKSADFGGMESVSASFASSQGVSFSLAERFWDKKLHLGLSGKYIQHSEAAFSSSLIDAQSIKDLNKSDLLKTGSGTGVDLGLLYLMPGSTTLAQHSFGVTVHNLGETKIIDAEGAETGVALVQTLNVGYAIELGTHFSRVRLLADYRDITSQITNKAGKKLHLGSEISVLRRFGAVAGIQQGYPSAGFYVDAWAIRFDGGFYGVERSEYLGVYPDRRFYFRMQVGI